MNHFKNSLRWVAVVAILGVAVSVLALGSYTIESKGDDDDNDHDRQAHTYQYAVKFLCGTTDAKAPGPVVTGTYQTAINIHNPNATAVIPTRNGLDFRKKAVLLFPQEKGREGFEVPQQPGLFVSPKELPANWGMEIDCDDIRSVLLLPDGREKAPFIKGFIIIEAKSSIPLDVVAAYTASTAADPKLPPSGISEQIQTVIPKVIR